MGSHSTCRLRATGALCALCATFAVLLSAAQAQPPNHDHDHDHNHYRALPQASNGIVTHRIFAADGVVQLLLEIPIPGKQITKEQQVQEPIQVNGVVKFRTVTVTRSVQATEQKRVPAKGLVTFCDLKGTAIDADEVAKQVPPEGLVVVLAKTKKIPNEWREVLKPGTIAMLQVPRP